MACMHLSYIFYKKHLHSLKQNAKQGCYIFHLILVVIPSTQLDRPIFCHPYKTDFSCEYQPKLNNKHMPFLHCISSFEGIFIRYSHQIFHFLLFYIKHEHMSFFCSCPLNQLLYQEILFLTNFQNFIGHYLGKDFSGKVDSVKVFFHNLFSTQQKITVEKTYSRKNMHEFMLAILGLK